MSQIPVDLDQTMWDIAERADSKAAADFSERFPDLAQAMQSRMNLIAGMKNVRKAITPSFVPGFTPRFLYKPKPKWKRYGPLALSIAALAAASFYVTQNLLTPLPDASSFRTAPPPAPKTPTVDLPPPTGAAPNYGVMDSPMPYKDQSGNANSLGPVHIMLSQVHLVNAIKAIGHRYHVAVEISKDFPDPVVDVDLVGSDAMTFLNQLGHENGFTAYDEGSNHVLLVPARDASSGQSGP